MSEQLALFACEHPPSPVRGLSWADYLHAVFVIGGTEARRLRAQGWCFELEDGTTWPEYA